LKRVESFSGEVAQNHAMRKWGLLSGASANFRELHT